MIVTRGADGLECMGPHLKRIAIHSATIGCSNCNIKRGDDVMLVKRWWLLVPWVTLQSHFKVFPPRFIALLKRLPFQENLIYRPA